MEPTRIEQDGGTPDELALLRAARRERAPEGAPARAVAAISLLAGVTVVGAPAAATAASSSVALGLGKWFAAGALLGVVSAGSVQVLSRAESAPSAVERGSAPSVEATKPPVVPDVAAPVAAPTEAVPPVELPPPSDAVPPPTKSATTASAAPRAGTLAEERALLERARAALRSGATGDAAHALSRYAERFRAGALADEASVLRIELALARGDAPLAVTLCDAYLASRADGPLTARIRAMRERALGKK